MDKSEENVKTDFRDLRVYDVLVTSGDTGWMKTIKVVT